jgi:hypothetical protein
MIKGEYMQNNLQKPVCAFITFVKDDHKTIAMSFAEHNE